MAKIIVKDALVTWTWEGDLEALRGFNVALCYADETPLTTSAAVAQVMVSSQRDYIFKNLILTTAVDYQAFVQAIYDGGDSDWISTGSPILIVDDGLNTIAKHDTVRLAGQRATVDASGILVGSGGIFVDNSILQAKLDIITADQWLSKGEKTLVIKEWSIIEAEKTLFTNAASAINVSSINYMNALNSLYSYLVSINFDNTEIDTEIGPVEFRTKFIDYYIAKEELRKLISDKELNTLQNQLNDIASDSILSRSEKSSLNILSKTIEQEYIEVRDKADSLLVSKDAYINAIGRLDTWKSLHVGYDNTTIDTILVSGSSSLTPARYFTKSWGDVNSEKQLLINAIATKVSTMAQWDSVSDPNFTKPDDNATKGATWATNVIGKPTIFDSHFENASMWTPAPTLVSSIGSSGGTVLRAIGPIDYFSKDYLAVDTSKVYLSTCKARRAGGTTGIFYAGFACYNKDKQFIAPIPAGGTYNYSAFGGINLSSTWTTGNGIIDQPIAADSGALHFRPGTAYIRLMLLCNYQGGPSDITEVDLLDFYDITESYNAAKIAIGVKTIVDSGFNNTGEITKVIRGINLPIAAPGLVSHGLNLTQDFLGFYEGRPEKVIGWKAYIGSNGDFKLGDGINHPGLAWNQNDGILAIRGKITADDIVSGTLTGRKISGGEIAIGTPINGVQPFSVDSNGILTANGANISGIINMKPGSKISWSSITDPPNITDDTSWRTEITGTSIKSSTIIGSTIKTSDNVNLGFYTKIGVTGPWYNRKDVFGWVGGNPGIKIDSSGMYGYGAGGEPKFTLSAADGSLMVNGGTITGGTINGGTITGGTINGGTINGGSFIGSTITGGKFQTGNSGPRIEISDTDIGDKYAHSINFIDDQDRSRIIIGKSAFLGYNANISIDAKIGEYGIAISAHNQIGIYCNSGFGKAIYAKSTADTAITAVSSTGIALKAYAGDWQAKLALQATAGDFSHGVDIECAGSGVIQLNHRGNLPTIRNAGLICYYNGWLCFANGTHWYNSNGNRLT